MRYWLDDDDDDDNNNIVISKSSGHNVLFIKYFVLLCRFILNYSFPDKVSFNRQIFEMLVQTQILLYYCPLLAETGLAQQLLVEVYNTKGNAIPVQNWTGPDGSRTLRLSDIMTIGTHESGKLSSHMYRPPLPPRKYSRYSVLLEAESTPGP
jgi:hypothetical protein